ncbi:uncharacterized protein LOC128681690 isoform X2 [Plodia interpunctella]|uniref:uncharacterized protein LOC128681690 isoform X2 n=1 Tax=Plodia interpunctella TaxID=58824 RepID=UPI002368ACCC|nr:uncharacterized protein LOC128681690 isoform X2 [Plodia interpunctella]
MTPGSSPKSDHCPCCKDCTNCSGFQKVLAVPGAGYVLYRHTTRVDDINKKTRVVETTIDTVDDVFILENTEGNPLGQIDVTPDRSLIKCPRCAQYLQHAQRLLKNQDFGKSDIAGICEHCRKYGSTCVKCEKAVEQFQQSRNARKADHVQRVKTWLSKIQNIIKVSLFDDVKRNRARMARRYSDVDLNNLRQITKLDREPEVEDLFLHGIRDFYATKRGPKSERQYRHGKDKEIAFYEPSKTYDDRETTYVKGRFDFIPTRGIHPDDESLMLSNGTLSENELEKNFIYNYGKSYKSNLKYSSPVDSKWLKDEDFIPMPGVHHEYEKYYYDDNSHETRKYDDITTPKTRHIEEKPKDIDRQISKGEPPAGKRYDDEMKRAEVDKKSKSYGEDAQKDIISISDEEEKLKKYDPLEEKILKFTTDNNDRKRRESEKKIGKAEPETKIIFESPSRIRKYRSEESLLTGMLKMKDDVQKNKTFDYYFPETIEGRKKIKREKEVSSSELIKDTLDKLKNKIEEERRKREEAERLKEERRKKLEREKRETEARMLRQKMEKLKGEIKHHGSKEELLEYDKGKYKVSKEKVPKDKSPKEKVSKDKMSKQKVAQEKESKEKASEKISKEMIPKERVSKEKVPKDKSPKEKVSKDKLSKEKESKEKASKEKAPKDKVPKEKESKEKVKKEAPESNKQEKPEKKIKDDSAKEKKLKEGKVKEEKEKEVKRKEEEKVKEKVPLVVDENEAERKRREVEALERKLKMDQQQGQKEEQLRELKLQREEAKKQQLEQQKKAKEMAEKMKRAMQSETPQQKFELTKIKVKRPSIYDLIDKRNKFKRATPPENLKMPSPIVIKKHKRHGKQESSCDLCMDSDYEFDVQNVLWIKEDDMEKKENLKEAVLGTNIYKYKNKFGEQEERETQPILFHKNYGENFDQSVEEEERVPRIEVKKDKAPVKQEQDYGKGVIKYALSNRTFIEKGWTKLPTEKVVRRMNVYRMRPAHPEFDWFERNKRKGIINYDSGEKLAEFEDSGRGRWYYRSGLLALDHYTPEEMNAQQRFVVYSSGEPDQRGRSRPRTVLATFDYLGNGIVFDHTGKIRLKYNQSEGIVLDRGLGPVSHWKWHTLNDPPVLQQVMIDTQMSHKDPYILKLATPNEDQPRIDDEDILAIEFDNFIKEKSQKLTQSFKPFQIKMKALKINEYFSLRVLDQANVHLIFRDGSTNINLNIGMILDHKEIVDTDTAEVGEVSSNLERLPAKTDSLAELQRSVAEAQRIERVRFERDKRINRPEQVMSVDRLRTAESKALKPPIMTVDSKTGVSRLCKCRQPSASNVYYNTGLV